MSHIVIITDAEDQTIDVHHYCSDHCARTDPAYSGWYGAQEYAATECLHCGAPCGSSLELVNTPTRTRRRNERDWARIMSAISRNALAAWERSTEADRQEGLHWYPRRRAAIAAIAADVADRHTRAWDDNALAMSYSATGLINGALIDMICAGYPRPDGSAFAEQVALLAAHTLARLSQGTAWDQQEKALTIVVESAAAALAVSRLGKYTMSAVPIPREFLRSTLFTKTARAAWYAMPALYPDSLSPGNKLHNFALNLAGSDHAVTLDRHMWRILGAFTTRAARAAADRHYHEAASICSYTARRVGVKPAELQATLWTLRKRELRDGISPVGVELWF